MKIHIVGASGSGVTTLGQALTRKLSIPYFDSDDYFWLPSDPPFTKRQDPIERNKRIAEDLAKTQNWILGGSVFDWGENLFPKFDLIVFLYLPQQTRMERLKKREMERYGDSIATDPERQTRFTKFLAWAEDYDNHSGIANRTLKAHKAWLATIKEPILKIEGNLSVQERMERILEKLSEEKL